MWKIHDSLYAKVELIKKRNVLAVLGNVGTPTANVTGPIANREKTLLFGAFTGAGILRQNPPQRYVINYRASYAQETSMMIEGLLRNGIQPEEIALFTQNDSYGDAGYFGVVKALQKNGFHEVHRLKHGRYTRNTLNVEEALSVILEMEKDPKAIILVGAYAPVAKFIRLAKEDFPDTLFLNVSFVGSDALKKNLQGDTKNVIITQVVPHFDSKLPIVEEYIQDLKKYFPEQEPNFVSLEGYIVAKIFVLVTSKIHKDTITREEVIDAFEGTKNLDIGLGFISGFSTNNHQYSHTIWPTMIMNDQFIEFRWDNLYQKLGKVND